MRRPVRESVRTIAARRLRALRACLRLARRELTGNRMRSAILVLLVALPVWFGESVALVTYNSRDDGERLAYQEIGSADAQLVVTEHPKIEVTYPDGSTIDARPVIFEGQGGKERPVTRDPQDVRLGDLLPAGTRTTPAPRTGDVAVATGGTAQVTEIDLEDPLSRGMFEIDSGRAPDGPDDVAVTQLMADEFGWIAADGTLTSDARLMLADGRSLSVVAVLADDDLMMSGHPAQLVVVPGSGLLEESRERTLLLDLPSGVEAARLRRLVDDLANHGLALMPRDVFLDPQAWGAVLGAPSAVDPRALAAGAITVAVGAVGIIVIVGGAFAVGARRRIRHLGMLMAAGSAPLDIRLLLLAEGFLIGFAAAVVGVVSAALTFRIGAPAYADLAGLRIWDRDLQLPTMGLLSLGALATAMLASAAPAWSASKLMPVAARGDTAVSRPPTRTGRRIGCALAAVGLALVGLAGAWIARVFSGSATTSTRSGLEPIAVGVAGFVTLVASAVLVAPHLVRLAATLRLPTPVAWRMALRDADRHRARTVAAALAVTMAVALSVLTGFAIQGVGEFVKRDPNAPPMSVLVYLDDGDQSAVTAGTKLAQTLSTLDAVVGGGQTLIAYRALAPGQGRGTLAFDNGNGFTNEIRVTDEAALRRLLGGPNPRAARILTHGGMVTTERPDVSGTTVAVAAVEEGRHGPATKLEVAWTDDRGIAGTADLGTAWISRETAKRLGMSLISTTVFRQVHQTVTTDQLSRLELRGINAVAPDAEFAWLPMVSVGAILAAGLLSLLIAAIAISLTSTDGRGNAATMAAIGASPSHQRRMGAVHGLLIGTVGTALGLSIGVPGGLAFGQLDGSAGVTIPTWTWLVSVSLPVLSGIGGYLVVPTRLTLVRRVG